MANKIRHAQLLVRVIKESLPSVPAEEEEPELPDVPRHPVTGYYHSMLFYYLNVKAEC